MEPVSMILTIGAAVCFSTATPRWDYEIEMAQNSAITYLPKDALFYDADDFSEEEEAIYDLVGTDFYQDFAKEDIYQDIEKFAHLPDDWDGEGASAAAPASIESARHFIKDLDLNKIPLPKAMISNEGRIEFYWDFESVYADISFDENGFSSFYMNSNFGEVFKDQMNLSNGLLDFIQVYIGNPKQEILTFA